jgi:heme A synthase
MKKSFLFVGLLSLVLNSYFVLAAEDITNRSSMQIVPEGLQSAARFIFALDSSQVITLSHLIILIVVFFALLLIISSVMEFVPFFEGIKSWIGAIVITLLMSVSGGLRDASSLLFELGDRSSASNLGKIWLVLIVAVILVIGWGISKALKIVRDKIGIEEAEQVGRDVSLKPLLKKLKEKGVK